LYSVLPLADNGRDPAMKVRDAREIAGVGSGISNVWSHTMEVGSDTQAACLACLDRFIVAVNAYDLAAMEREMHFPHVRIALGTIMTYSQRGSNPLDLFERLQREDGWHRSEWIGKSIVQGDANKIHVAVRYRRMRSDGSVIGDYDSLYILTHLHDRWGIQARSSFGP
jgi:hypothetical protein